MDKQDIILLEQLINKYGKEAVVEKLNLPPAVRRRAINGLVGAGIGLGVIGAGNLYTKYHRDANTEQVETVIPIEEQIPNYFDIVQGVSDCMKYAVSCIGNSETDIDLDPEQIVQLCYKYEFDLATLLGVLWQESHMGTTPRAKKTGSPFSMGLYDNGKNRITYDDPNESIEDYILHMRNSFQRGRSLADTFKDGQLTNDLGQRYATDPKYEGKIRYLRNLALKVAPQINELDFYHTNL